MGIPGGYIDQIVGIFPQAPVKLGTDLFHAAMQGMHPAQQQKIDRQQNAA
jgi:hypothetical protein